MSEPVRIRDMREADLETVAGIERRCYSVPWSYTTFLGLLRREDADMLVAESGGVLLGYAVFWQVLDQGELGNVAVDPPWRRRGIARMLVGAVIERARARGVLELFLEVRPSNTGARHLYDSFGFVPVGQRRNYYQEPVEDAVVMRVLLPQARGARGAPIAGAGDFNQ